VQLHAAKVGIHNFYISNISTEFCAMLNNACLPGSMPGWFASTMKERCSNFNQVLMPGILELIFLYKSSQSDQTIHILLVK
jgi:hypothetical protein